MVIGRRSRCKARCEGHVHDIPQNTGEFYTLRSKAAFNAAATIQRKSPEADREHEPTVTARCEGANARTARSRAQIRSLSRSRALTTLNVVFALTRRGLTSGSPKHALWQDWGIEIIQHEFEYQRCARMRDWTVACFRLAIRRRCRKLGSGRPKYCSYGERICGHVPAKLRFLGLVGQENLTRIEAENEARAREKDEKNSGSGRG